MSEQQVLNHLSELEEYFYYKQHNPGKLSYADLSELHDKVNDMLIKWHQMTGCKLQ